MINKFITDVKTVMTTKIKKYGILTTNGVWWQYDLSTNPFCKNYCRKYEPKNAQAKMPNKPTKLNKFTELLFTIFIAPIAGLIFMFSPDLIILTGYIFQHQNHRKQNQPIPFNKSYRTYEFK